MDLASLPRTVEEARYELDQILLPQQEAHSRSKSQLDEAAEHLAGWLEGLLNGIEDFRVEKRVKPWVSIKAKLEDGRIQEWDRCPDLLAAQVVVISGDRTGPVLAALSQHRLDGTQSRRFWYSSMGRSRGYAAVHLQVMIPDHIDVGSNIRKVGAEVQVLTEMQFVWHRITHNEIYKAAETVPVEIRHSVHRLAAAIDLLDSEVVQIKENLESQRKRIAREWREMLASGSEWRDLPLDEVTLENATKKHGR